MSRSLWQTAKWLSSVANRYVEKLNDQNAGLRLEVRGDGLALYRAQTKDPYQTSQIVLLSEQDAQWLRERLNYLLG